MMNKTIVVLGASRGIGRELVLQFAADKNNTVVALSRNGEAMKDSFQGIDNIHFGKIDLIAEDLHEQLEQQVGSFNQIDFLVNNAGAIVNRPFLELSRKEMNICYQTNAVGTMFATQYFVPKMLKNGGHIVNISTMGAFQGSVKFPGLSAYSSSKASVVVFTELFAEEFKETNIRMNCLCLGAVQTEMLEEAFPGYKAPITPEEMAKFIVDFTLNASRFFNGKILPVSTSTP